VSKFIPERKPKYVYWVYIQIVLANVDLITSPYVFLLFCIRSSRKDCVLPATEKFPGGFDKDGLAFAANSKTAYVVSHYCSYLCLSTSLPSCA